MRSILRSPWLRAAFLLCLTCALCLSATASSVPTAGIPAAVSDSVETLYSAEYCFCEADFHADTMTDLSGIFVTGVPEEAVAAVRLGQRVIRAGDVLPLECLSQLTLQPACGGDCDAVLTYNPRYASGTAGHADHPHQIRQKRGAQGRRHRV